MKRKILLYSALAIWATGARAQMTTYGGGGVPFDMDNAYVSDYAAAGTVVLVDGAVNMINNSTYEHGNTLLQNNGTWSSLSGSADIFVGAGANTISGSNAPDFFNVHFNNGITAAMNIANTEGINVAGQLQFSNGLTTTVRNNTAAGAVHFAAGATYTGGLTDAQHVDGYVSKAGTTAFTFPAGSATDLRTLAITAPSSPTELSVAWFAGNPSSVTDPSDAATHSTTAVASPLLSVCDVGFWDWMLVSGSDDGLTVTVSIPNVDFYAVTANLRLAGWNGTQWIDLSGAATASGNTENETLSGTIPAGQTITAIAIASTTVPLPVEFGSFTATADRCAVNLNWTTLSERNSDYFTVLRSSDGATFRELGRVEATGNSTGSTYSFRDNAPALGMNYYRLRQTDLDGSSSYTSVQRIQIDCGEGEIRVYPTLTTGLVTVELPSALEGAQLELYTELGQKMSCEMQGTPARRTIRLDALPLAQYLLRVVHGAEVHTFKLLKQ